MSDPHPFDLVDRSFRRMCRAKPPLALPGRAVGLPGGELNLFEIRESLLRHGAPYAARDAFVGELVRRTVRLGEPWGTGLVGVLMPGLRAQLGALTRAFPALRADVESEAILGVLERAREPRLGSVRIAARLIGSARTRAGRLVAAHVREERRCPLRPEIAATGAAEPSHPDLALLRACCEGVVTPAEMELVGETRLGRVRTADYARGRGEPYGSLRMRRLRAEHRLVAWIRDSAD